VLRAEKLQTKKYPQMKTLILVRHAKADNPSSSMHDYDRTLSRCGGRDAGVIAKRLAGSGIRSDALISSPAVRALSTAEIFATELRLTVQTDARIYEARVNELLAVVRGLDDRHSTVVLVGHNPGISEFLRYLTDENYADLPTAGLVTVSLPLKSWRHIFDGKGLLKESFSPKTNQLEMRSDSPVLDWIARFRFWRFQRAQRLEIIIALVVGFLLLMLFVPLLMRQSTDSSSMPQQGSVPR
jgi:phosphohistidine phosphatase